MKRVVKANSTSELVDLMVKTVDGNWVKIFEQIPEPQAYAIWKAGFATGKNIFSIETEEGKRVSRYNESVLRKIKSSANIDVEIPTLDEYLRAVKPKDRALVNELMKIRTFNGQLFSAPSKRNELGKTKNYSAEDKVIQISEETPDYTVYQIPYTSYKYRGVIGIFTFPLICYNDGTFSFGKGHRRTLGKVSDSTLSNDVYKARNQF